MSEKENKFIPGEHADGYRRSAGADKTQPFVMPDFPESIYREKPKQVRPSERPSAQPAKKTAAGAARSKAAAGRTEKSAQNRQGKRTASSAAPARRKPAGGQDKNLSANERKQKHNELRRIKKKRKQTLTYIFISVVVLAIAVVLSLTVFFQINEITVKGNSPYTQQEVIAASGITMGENIIMCDADGVSEKLSKALPYIGGATVERSASGKVVINITLTEPKWSFLGETNAVLVNEDGKVLEIATPEKALEATIVQGAQVVSAIPGETVLLGAETPLGMLASIGKAFDDVELDKLTMLNISDVDYIQALYDSRLTIIIGSTENLKTKIALTAGVIERENEINPTQYGTIDLTIDDKAYFRPEENPENAYYDESEEMQENATQEQTIS